MKFRSADGRLRQDLAGFPWQLAEGEFYFGGVCHGVRVFLMLWCRIPEKPTGPSGLPLNTTREIAGRHTWRWDGNVERPTLTPSIACGPDDARTWHGHLTSGRFAACE